MKIGIVGLGRMGAGMAARLQSLGVRAKGWDVDRNACERAKGDVDILGDAVSVVDVSDVIITSLPDDHIVESLFFNSKSNLILNAKNKIFLETSTLRPETGIELASEIERAAGEFVDMPVLGSIPAARGGNLVGLVGGTERGFSRASQVVEMLTSKVFRLGPTGSGYAMKLAVNLGLAGYIQALSEGFALGERHGLSAQMMLEVFGTAPTANVWLEAKRSRLMGGAGDISLDLVTLRKDLMSAVSAGTSLGIPMPLTSATLAALSASVAAGWAKNDCADQVKFFRNLMVQRER